MRLMPSVRLRRRHMDRRESLAGGLVRGQPIREVAVPRALCPHPRLCYRRQMTEPGIPAKRGQRVRVSQSFLMRSRCRVTKVWVVASVSGHNLNSGGGVLGGKVTPLMLKKDGIRSGQLFRVDPSSALVEATGQAQHTTCANVDPPVGGVVVEWEIEGQQIRRRRVSASPGVDGRVPRLLLSNHVVWFDPHDSLTSAGRSVDASDAAGEHIRHPVGQSRAHDNIWRDATVRPEATLSEVDNRITHSASERPPTPTQINGHPSVPLRHDPSRLWKRLQPFHCRNEAVHQSPYRGEPWAM